MDEFIREPIVFADMTVTLPREFFAGESELYVSVAGRALYLKTKRQYSHFMNGARRIGNDKIAAFYRECMNNTYVVDYAERSFEACPEMGAVLRENEPLDVVFYSDGSGAVIAAKSFLDERM
ncbi:MAG: hypothetical protein ACI4IV_07775 [Acutalibacteraceae bacterium]